MTLQELRACVCAHTHYRQNMINAKKQIDFFFSFLEVRFGVQPDFPINIGVMPVNSLGPLCRYNSSKSLAIYTFTQSVTRHTDNKI